jgi:large subunit ribosomal protein L23
MNEKRLYSIIVGPLTTEKSTRLGEKHHQMAFEVLRDATKTELKEAVNKLFGVVVTSVRIVNVKGKNKQFKQRQGERSNWKKAYVRLAEGHDINVANFQ